jgi:hypothetical protein
MAVSIADQFEILFSASKQFFLAEMMCKQLIFCVNAAIRLPMSVMLLFIDFKNKKNICTRQKPKVYRKFNASTDIVIRFLIKNITRLSCMYEWS